MVETDRAPGEQPIVQPRVVRFLRDRNRLVDKGVREDFLDQLESNMVERRKPDTLAEKTVRDLFRRFEDAGSGVAKERVRGRMEKANQNTLSKL